MPVPYHLTIERKVAVEHTPRLMQLSGLFDVPITEESVQRWEVKFDLPDEWNVGLIVGPSGCGKTTIANELWPDKSVVAWLWSESKSIVDCFPATMSIKDITWLLSSVGFSSPPSWLRPFRALSNGEQFRVNVARTLAEYADLAVIDEFTSVVDRDVAKIASAAVAKTVRRRNQKLVAVSCHHDIAEWLEPDWIYQPHTGEFIAGRLLRRPTIRLEIQRVHSSAWEFFKHHHYLTMEHSKAAQCFVAFWEGNPVAYCSVLSFPHAKRPGWIGHRFVCLPDWQGTGIGMILLEYLASMFAATGKPFRGSISHPGLVRHLSNSPLWKCTRDLSLMTNNPNDIRAKTLSTNRMTASFEYIGPKRPLEARRFGIVGKIG